METEPPWEQGQSDFPSQGVRDTLPHVSRATRRDTHVHLLLGSLVPETIGRFLYPIPHPLYCVLSLLLCSLLLQTQISGIHEGTSDWLCLFLFQGLLPSGTRFCEVGEVVHSCRKQPVHPYSTPTKEQECCLAFCGYFHASIPSSIQVIR